MRDHDIFDFFSNRLSFVEVSKDPMLNIELWHCMSSFESHVYGVTMQYNRIKLDLSIEEPQETPNISNHQAGLDIYYYILTWDKLKKVNNKLKTIINRIHQTTSSIPEDFSSEFRQWKRRIEHLFSEFDEDVRNEYEHPSLEPYSVGNILAWGSILIDSSGDIKAHAGNEHFAIVKNEHNVRLQHLRTELVDLFLKHFSQKPLTQELVRLRSDIEKNFDSIVKELQKLRDDGKDNEFNELVHSLMMIEISLRSEGVALSTSIKDRFYSIIYSNVSGTPN